MHVPVDDQHTVQPESLHGRSSRDRDVAEQTESHRRIGPGVMSRRSHQAQRLVVFTTDNSRYCVDAGSGCKPRNVRRIGAHDRVGFNPPASLIGETPNSVDVVRSVDPFNIRVVGALNGNLSHQWQQVRRLQVCVKVLKPSGTFRMLTGVVQQEFVVHVKQCHVSGSFAFAVRKEFLRAAMNDAMPLNTAEPMVIPTRISQSSCESCQSVATHSARM